MPEARVCLVCRRPLKGRADKKFCDDHCRNAFNNQLKTGKNLYVRYINKVLKRNRRVLEALCPPNKKQFKVSKERLMRLGFSLEFFTHSETDENGEISRYCYEFGYVPVEDDQFLVTKRREELRTPASARDDWMQEQLKDHN